MILICVFLQDLSKYFSENNLKLNLEHFDFLLDPPLKRIRNIWLEFRRSANSAGKPTAESNVKPVDDVKSEVDESSPCDVTPPVRSDVPYELLGVVPPNPTPPGKDIHFTLKRRIIISFFL